MYQTQYTTSDHRAPWSAHTMPRPHTTPPRDTGGALIPAGPRPSARAVILPPELETELKADGGKRRAVAQRLDAFASWLDATRRQWTAPDLAAYRDRMLADGKSPSTVNAHLSTIRGRYDTLLSDNDILDDLRDQARAYLEANELDADLANVKAATDMLTESLRNGISPKHTSARQTTKQDDSEETFIRLTKAQANALIAAPGTDTLQGLRDTALIALALATGARAAELCALQVGDHKIRHRGELAMLIRRGKGDKQRVVYYGEQSFVVAIVDAWLLQAGITEGPIFRGFFRGGKRIRKSALTVVSVEQIVGSYPVMIDGERRTVKPHDLRRSYAKLMYLVAGMPVVAIQRNLGHESHNTTIRYIGELDKERVPEAVLSFNLAALPAAPGV